MYSALIVMGPLFAGYLVFLTCLNAKLAPSYLSIFIVVYGLPAVLIAPAKVIESKSLKWVTHIGSTIIILNIFLFVFCSLYFGAEVVDLYFAGCTGIEKSPEEILLEKNLANTSLKEVGVVSVQSGLAAGLSAATVRKTMETFKIPKVGSITSPQLVAVPVIIESVNQVVKGSGCRLSEVWFSCRT
jgi:hypothetical protein